MFTNSNIPSFTGLFICIFKIVVPSGYVIIIFPFSSVSVSLFNVFVSVSEIFTSIEPLSPRMLNRLFLSIDICLYVTN